MSIFLHTIEFVVLGGEREKDEARVNIGNLSNESKNMGSDRDYGDDSTAVADKARLE